ncbi:2-dehydro-3-deoxygalactonokinase [Pararobbsia alpina]|uniref:Putative 2-dehydro-3-deoxygalactonokinase DgoK1 n=1 Tax=Pararobbsia alpina TaxID=621374 RepID=A0A6S7ATJ2_9BURK|nr:2-dehydro-3-deoxygalactonokinase [Pararobbsia alpina]CAB3777393.1 putative 2-dehydro-3-deoxygalactonokinase DgoK1 [Pararobbsia alpina]
MIEASSVAPAGDATRIPAAQEDLAQAVMIALDWGTSSLRAYLFGARGKVLGARNLPWGIMKLPCSASEGGFDAAFEAACGDWLDARPGLPLIACGMVGSAQGWIEARYIDTPADANRLASSLAEVRTARGAVLHIVPGVLERGTLPNVMRGEETQILGAMLIEPQATGTAPHAEAGAAREDAASGAHTRTQTEARACTTLVGLPGSHAKWAIVEGSRIEHFHTFMTGETFAALRDHTILGRTMQTPAAPDNEAFLRGVAVARGASEAGMLATIFSTRTLGLTGQLGAEQQPDYLSGLLIGHELSGLENLLEHTGANWDSQPVLLIGEAALVERYRLALAHFGCRHARPVANATERGLWQIATQAGLAQP